MLKFRGAGQGPKVLVAEVVVGELARRARPAACRGWPSSTCRPPSPATRPTRRSRTCSPPASASTSESTSSPAPSATTAPGRRAPDMAADILWLDALTANVDRTWGNPNLLVWHGEPWCIDHGAALYFHHQWPSRAPDPGRFAAQSFDVSRHVLVDVAGNLRAAHEKLTSLVSEELLDEVTDQVPDLWLEQAPEPGLPRRRPRGIPRPPARPGGLHGLAPGRRAMSLQGYQYVVLRCVPRVEREEFVNVGVVLYSQSADFLGAPLRRRRGTAARARARPRPRGGARLPRDRVPGMPRGHRRRPAGPGQPGPALRLAQRSTEHRRPAWAGPRRAHGRPRGRAGGPARTAGCAPGLALGSLG